MPSAVRNASRKATGAMPREKCKEEVCGLQDPDASWAKAGRVAGRGEGAVAGTGWKGRVSHLLGKLVK